MFFADHGKTNDDVSFSSAIPTIRRGAWFFGVVIFPENMFEVALQLEVVNLPLPRGHFNNNCVDFCEMKFPPSPGQFPGQ